MNRRSRLSFTLHLLPVVLFSTVVITVFLHGTLASEEPGDQDRAIRATIVIESTLSKDGIGETRAICIVNQEKLTALESFFPGYRRLPSSDEAGAWEAKYRVYFDFPGGKSICVTVSENHDAGYWSVGRGDFETKGNFNEFVDGLAAAPGREDKQAEGLRRDDPGIESGAASPASIREKEAVWMLFRRIKASMDGTEPPESWPEKMRHVGTAWVVDIDTSRLPGGYPEQIVIDITGTGGHSGNPKR